MSWTVTLCCERVQICEINCQERMNGKDREDINLHNSLNGKHLIKEGKMSKVSCVILERKNQILFTVAMYLTGYCYLILIKAFADW